MSPGRFHDIREVGWVEAGATDQAAGLATAAGSKVKVETTGEGASAIATKITVEAKDKK